MNKRWWCSSWVHTAIGTTQTTKDINLKRQWLPFINLALCVYQGTALSWNIHVEELNTPCGPSLITYCIRIKYSKTVLINVWYLSMTTIFIPTSTLAHIILFRNLFLLMLQEIKNSLNILQMSHPFLYLHLILLHLYL